MIPSIQFQSRLFPALIACGLLSSLPLEAADPVNFNRDIRPILSDRCFHCHGPDEHDRKAKLRLDQAGGPHGAYRSEDGVTAIVPGSISESELWHRITTEDRDDIMPPPKARKKPLTAAEKELVKRWIEGGAAYEDFWAFVPPRKPAPARVKDRKWSSRPIDLFVLRKLEAEGLAPSPPADRRTLIRRLTLDLTGLPPTREEIATFLADKSNDAYERLVDRLLAKPQYGEHMTKYWLDLVRFADTNGIHHDHYREMTPYRDWVIRAFNDNLSYDDFIVFQLAGDLYPEPARDQLIASGFNRLHLIIDVGTALPEESYTRNVIDRVTSVGTTLMGLTVQCAVCHDHKYDPFTMRDFYQLSAFFNNLDAAPETGRRSGTDFRRGLQPPYLELATDAQKVRLKELENQVTAATGRVNALKQASKKSQDAAEKKTLAADLKTAEQKLKTAQKARDDFEATLPAAMVMKEKAEPSRAHILIRGAYDNPGAQVERGTPAFLPPMNPREGAATRMDLAEWFMAPEHPLTARVAVNRLWQQFFGVGIVKTSEDFGAQGEWPSHPDLLDHLAASFIGSGWDIKALIKEIVLSETYRQSSEADPADFERDPENRLLARGSRFRMDSEMIRDQVLATSGLLNKRLYGKSVKPPQPEGVWDPVVMPSSYPKEYVPDTGDAIYRRSLYTFWKRGMPPPQMTILNAPSREECIARRERTNTPLQALLLMNEQEYLKAARHLALATLAKRAPRSGPVPLLDIIYETVTSQLPDAAERKTLIAALKDLRTLYRENPALAGNLCEGAEIPGRASMGAWLSYGLGTMNRDLPDFIVLTSAYWTGGTRNVQGLYSRLWGSGPLPSKHQGVAFQTAGDPVLFLSNPKGIDARVRRRMLDAVGEVNRKHFDEIGDAEIETTIAQQEMAFRMQASVPELTDVAGEPAHIADMYGPEVHKSGSFARNCLLARRMVERGVRFIQIFHRGWDHHTILPKQLPGQCFDIDQPSAALITDLKQRGLLDETMIVFAGEFGRTAFCQGKLERDDYGRDHHPRCFSAWAAGGGIQGGIEHGETDDFSYNVARDPVAVRDLHATMLHQLGIDHDRLTFPFQGLDQRLTGVEEARVVKDILA